MNSRLLRGYKGEAREKQKQYLLNNREILDTIKSLMKEDFEQSLKDMRDVENYNRPAYHEYLADQLGYQRALAKYVAMLTLDQGDLDD